ncbi:50S ribosomal protein L4 [Candidatus Epulonipiscium fishelsonii]|uniref:50S ribosomal protein L4 n=1 Tax=Candidatus Epulonipiscium fishelsonii TaxID=77094 RepID=A0ACC8XAP5_9FIRM|nr:50S ribosomal protein L4 [Epulopiscium sp. SCG-B11WGA-EpuloA1]ONI40135.1 50S ribosomal protein L4 [Epulopiscium sp. SCG-B05WGA-EpuloA1]ONI48005.1 50S ribosomal protein L4 [Epulopiscium sp. SCG-C06WGA-EpuloA1]
MKVLNINGKEVGNIELNSDIFGVEVKEHLIHAAVVAHLANKRQGTQSAKTRAEVRGGGRKPWKQKGTGRARQGSIRSPQWKGGGVVFAPKPRDYSFKLNKKERQFALKCALTTRATEQKIVVLDEIVLEQAKTKVMANILNTLKLKKALIVTEGESSRNVMLSANNIQGIKTSAVNNLNTYDVLKYDTFVVTKEALAKIEEVYA